MNNFKVKISYLALSACLSLITGQAFAQSTVQPLPYILDMVHNNPGEAPYVTKYNDPVYMKSQGFNGMVTHWFVNCAITYDNYEKGIVPENSKEREWIMAKAADIDKKLMACKKAGMCVYPFTDFIVFPKSLWGKYGNEITGKGKVAGTGGMDERSRKPDMQSKRTQDMLRAQIAGIFERFPQLDGLTLRFGETYLQDAPYHMGGGPIRDGKSGIEDHVTLINLLRDEICVKRNKKLFYRTWDFGYNFHNNPDYYLAVTNQIKPHPNLIFVIKYQQDDFHRMTPFNPTLAIGNHTQIVEAQSRMEAYGKGAHPYYTAKGVIDGWPETKYEIIFGRHEFNGKLNDPDNPRGIKDILSKGLLKGVMTWSNGGGWDGPYIINELWTDLNTYVLSQYAQHPEKSEETIFYEFARKLGLTGYEADLFRQLNLLTIEGVRKGQLNSYTANDVWWSRDQYFSAAENKDIVSEIISKRKEREVLAEKAEASAIWRQIEALSKQIHVNNAADQESIEVSCTYGRIKYELIEQMWILMIENGMAERNGSFNIMVIKQAINRYDLLWSEWKALKLSSKYCATLYTDLAFRNQRNGSIGELVDSLRKI
ncbi:hypothetical protein AB6805_02455 [Chitinophaga sp. RCC_12]|uniref:hypothetical protein n=1 Tax=Chitinophaga sp. RCC_12 TaxID=3239226 RepID=UPI0035264435